MVQKKRKTQEPVTPVAPPHREIPIRYFNRSDISDHLMCVICQEVFTEPTRISCGHTFCHNCIYSWFRSNRASCPTCRNEIIPAATHRDLLARLWLEQEEVFCKFPGCDWIGRLGSLENHMASCESDPSRLPEWVAGSPSSRSGLRMRIYNKNGLYRAALADASEVASEIDLTDSINLTDS
jgi:hypothetical protein